MKKVTIQAYEDRSRSEGGHAVILLQGITEPKGLVAFRVRPLDAARGPDGNGGWIGGEHLPVSVANTEYGLEIVAGPDVTESELLLPGTVVEIQIPASGVRGEFLWPNIAPLMRPKRRNIAIVKPRHTQRPADAPRDTPPPGEVPSNPTSALVEPAAPVQAEPFAAVQKDAAPPAADAFPYPVTAPEPAAAPEAPQNAPAPAKPAAAASTRPAEPIAFPFPATPVAPSAAPIKSAIPPAKPIETSEPWPAAAVSAEPAKSAPASAPLRAERATQAAVPAAQPEATKPSPSVKSDHRGEATMDQTKAGPGRALTAAEQELESEISDKYGWAFKKDLGVMLSKKFFALGASRHDDVQEEAIRATHHSDHHNIAAEATAILAHHEVDHTPVPVTDYTPTASLAEKPYSGGYAGDYESASNSFGYASSRAIAPFPSAGAEVAPGAGPEKRPLMETGMAAALIGLVAAGIAGIAILSNPADQGTDGPVTAAAPPSLTSAIAAPLNTPSPDLIFQALQPAAGASPRGIAAAGVGADKALENANRLLLTSGAQRDTEEGAFWLKHFITGTLGDNRTMRVLTQLGSIYAEPATGTPDYSKSRLVWEIAGAAGDPVAMCFLGLLHENGLGVAADKAAALQWYERAKAKGGCPSVDEALARLRN